MSHAPVTVPPAGQRNRTRSASFRARIAIIFGVLGTAIFVPLFVYVAHVLSGELIANHGQVVLDVAQSTATVLGENLNERRREVELLSKTTLLRRARLDDPEVRAAVDRLQASYGSYSWIGVADTSGVVQSSARNLLTGVDVSKRPWFIDGTRGTVLGDVHEALLLAKLLPQREQGTPLRFIDVSAPIVDDHGTLRGVLGTHIDWRWSEDIVKRLQPDHGADGAIEILLVDASGKVIYPERDAGTYVLSRSDPVAEKNAPGKWIVGSAYISAVAPVRTHPLVAGLGWRVLARQPQAIALRPVHALQRTMLLVGIGTGAVFLALVVWFAARVSRPLEHLVRQARRIEQGEEELALDVEDTTPEIARLGAALRSMTATLLRRRQEVIEINRTLEEKVTLRTLDLQKANEALERLARKDALTGLDNRLSAGERLQHEFARLKRSGRPYAVMLMDVDHFKRVNDTYGHDVGDLVLQRVAQTLKAAVRTTDFVARFGGEEFLVVLPDTRESDVPLVAEKVRRAVEETPVPPVGTITISIGVTLARGADSGHEAAVKRADEKLYDAKKGGRNCVALV